MTSQNAVDQNEGVDPSDDSQQLTNRKKEKAKWLFGGLGLVAICLVGAVKFKSMQAAKTDTVGNAGADVTLTVAKDNKPELPPDLALTRTAESSSVGASNAASTSSSPASGAVAGNVGTKEKQPASNTGTAKQANGKSSTANSSGDGAAQRPVYGGVFFRRPSSNNNVGTVGTVGGQAQPGASPPFSPFGPHQGVSLGISAGVANNTAIVNGAQNDSNNGGAIFARMIENPTLSLMAGKRFACVASGRVVVDLRAQSITCNTTEPVTGFDGKAVLLEAGTQIRGETVSGVQDGERRLAIRWKELVTPLGVIAALEADTSDVLGAGGVEADVDERWSTRISGAVMLSVFQDGVQYLTRSRSAGGVNINNTSTAGKDIASQVLSKTIKTPAEGSLQQDTVFYVVVMRTVNFARVYEQR